MIGCQKSSDTNPELKFRYIEEFCCGNLMILDGNTIDDSSGNIQDSLTYGVNLDDYIIPQNLEFGDEILIEYEVLNFPLPDDFEINCSSICNRHNGISIKILSLKKE